MDISLYDIYIKIHPYFPLELEKISNITCKEKFSRELKKEKQEVNFLSQISEFKFAQFLETEELNYYYEPTLNKKEPDFSFKHNSLGLIYFDVKRFNVPDLNNKNDEKLYLLTQNLKKIERPYSISIEQIENELTFDIETAIIEIQKWILSDKRKLNDSLCFQNSIMIVLNEIMEYCDHVLCSTEYHLPKINPSKIESNILDKIEAYKEVIIDKGIPFFVGIDLTFDTCLTPTDYWLEFLGSKNHLTNTGKFKTNSKLDVLSGILLRFQAKFYWIDNPNNKYNMQFRNALTNPS